MHLLCKLKLNTLHFIANRARERESGNQRRNFTVIKRNKMRSKHRPLNNHYSSQIWLIKKNTHNAHTLINAMYIKNQYDYGASGGWKMTCAGSTSCIKNALRARALTSWPTAHTYMGIYIHNYPIYTQCGTLVYRT